jgi:hypothetical protein
LKRDLLQAQQMLVGPSALSIDILKYTITGNLKQLQKLLQPLLATYDAH